MLVYAVFVLATCSRRLLIKMEILASAIQWDHENTMQHTAGKYRAIRRQRPSME